MSKQNSVYVHIYLLNCDCIVSHRVHLYPIKNTFMLETNFEVIKDRYTMPPLRIVLYNATAQIKMSLIAVYKLTTLIRHHI